jgi:hypothetical protein
MLNVEEFVLVWGVGTGTCTVESLRIPQLLAGAEEACWAHNPKVPGSKPGRATSFGLVRRKKLSGQYLLDLSQNRDISTRTMHRTTEDEARTV